MYGWWEFVEIVSFRYWCAVFFNYSNVNLFLLSKHYFSVVLFLAERLASNLGKPLFISSVIWHLTCQVSTSLLLMGNVQIIAHQTGNVMKAFVNVMKDIQECSAIRQFALTKIEMKHQKHVVWRAFVMLITDAAVICISMVSFYISSVRRTWYQHFVVRGEGKKEFFSSPNIITSFPYCHLLCFIIV